MTAQPIKIEPYQHEGPQPLFREIPAGSPYPVEALGPLRAAVEAVQGMTQAPLAIPAQSALAVASLALQGFANVETLGGDRPLSLYALTIAQSGERKSSCDAPLMAALRDYEKEQAKAQREDMTAWENTHAIWKGAREVALSKAKGKKGEPGDRAAAERELAILGAEPAAPPSPERVVTEPTYEGLTRLFAHGQPSLGIFSDEGGQFLGGFAMSQDNRQKTLAALNDLWQGNPIRRTRQGEGSFTLYGRRLAVHLMVQPSVARDFMADPMAGDTGFLPRFLIAEPPSAIGGRMHGNARYNDTALVSFSAQLRDILETPMLMDADTRELQPRRLPLSVEAKTALIRYSDGVEAAQAPGGDFEAITGYASKSAEQAARIAGVLTLWGNTQAHEVTGRTMADAISLARFYLMEALRLMDAATVSVELSKAEKLRRWMLSPSWGEPDLTLRDVVRCGPLREGDTAKSAIAVLVKNGWLQMLEAGTIIRGSARREAWRIVSE